MDLPSPIVIELSRPGILPNGGARKVPGKPKTLFDGRLLRELGSSKARKAPLETLAIADLITEAKSRH
jgi:hypothetical protein